MSNDPNETPTTSDGLTIFDLQAAIKRLRDEPAHFDEPLWFHVNQEWYQIPSAEWTALMKSLSSRYKESE
jgi:hypothetical protein